MKTIGRAFFQLLKPRVMSLVVFTGWVGLMLAPGAVHPFLAFMIIFSIALGAGGAGCLNMWYERDLDGLMHRTRNRPIPAGMVSADSALVFGLFTSGFALIFMGLAANWLASLYLLTANLWYVLVYTVMLKRTTPQNIVIGGASGAMPAVIGWVAVTGDNALLPWLLFLLVFLWTPPHFWALSLYASGDYQRARVPMMPNIHGIAYTKNLIVIYSIIMSLVAIAIGFVPPVGWLYLLVAVVLSFVFIAWAIYVWRNDNPQRGRGLFYYSIFYLFALFLAILIDHVV